MKENLSEFELWNNTKNFFDCPTVTLGRHWSYNYRNDPKRLGFVLSRYKFSAKMLEDSKKILELGCSEGIGATILAENASSYVGVDLDSSAIQSAKTNLESSKFNFICDDFMCKKYGDFDAVISLDVIEHIYKEFEEDYFKTIINNLSEDGIVIIGTPNIFSESYASQASKLGHVNLYSMDRLKTALEMFFYNVFPFGMNDEVMHTGFHGMCHYLILIACNRRSR